MTSGSSLRIIFRVAIALCAVLAGAAASSADWQQVEARENYTVYFDRDSLVFWDEQSKKTRRAWVLWSYLNPQTGLALDAKKEMFSSEMKLMTLWCEPRQLRVNDVRRTTADLGKGEVVSETWCNYEKDVAPESVEEKILIAVCAEAPRILEVKPFVFDPAKVSPALDAGRDSAGSLADQRASQLRGVQSVPLAWVGFLAEGLGSYLLLVVATAPLVLLSSWAVFRVPQTFTHGIYTLLWALLALAIYYATQATITGKTPAYSTVADFYVLGIQAMAAWSGALAVVALLDTRRKKKDTPKPT